MKEKLLKLLEEAEDLCNTTPCYECKYEHDNLCQSRILIDKILQQFDIVEKGSQQPKSEQFIVIEDGIKSQIIYLNKDSIEFIRFSEDCCYVEFKHDEPITISKPKLHSQI